MGNGGTGQGLDAVMTTLHCSRWAQLRCGLFVGWLIGCLTPQKHASASKLFGGGGGGGGWFVCFVVVVVVVCLFVCLLNVPETC